MYEQEFQGDIAYMMLYAVVAALNLVACCYLLFRTLTLRHQYACADGRQHSLPS